MSKPVTIVKRLFLRQEPAKPVVEPEFPEQLPSEPVSAKPEPQRSMLATGFLFGVGALLALALAFAALQLQQLVLMIVVALFLALGLNPTVEWLVKRKLRRGIAVVVVILIALILFGLGTWAILPVAAEQINALIVSAPGYMEELRSNPQFRELDERYRIVAQVTAFLTSASQLSNVLGSLLGAGQFLANAVMSIFITLVLTIYFLATMPAVKQTVYDLAPASKRARVEYLANEMFRRIGGYLSGVFIVVLCVSTVSFLYMTIIGLGRFALALTVVVAMFALIPLVGNTISMSLIALVAFLESPTLGIVTIVFFLVYQQFDAYVLQPRIFARSVNVPGPLVIIAVLAGAMLLGIVGALLAVPTTAALLLLYREVLLPALDRR